jgi:hypothetical protein
MAAVSKHPKVGTDAARRHSLNRKVASLFLLLGISSRSCQKEAAAQNYKPWQNSGCVALPSRESGVDNCVLDLLPRKGILLRKSFPFFAGYPKRMLDPPSSLHQHCGETHDEQEVAELTHNIQGERREAAAADARFVSDPDGCLAFAPPCGLGPTLAVALNGSWRWGANVTEPPLSTMAVCDPLVIAREQSCATKVIE